MNDLLPFRDKVDVFNFADDTILYKCGRDLELFTQKFEADTYIAIHCLKNKEMVASPKLFQLMFFARNKNIEREMSFAGKTIRFLNTAELLGITLDKNINIKSHIGPFIRSNKPNI